MTRQDTAQIVAVLSAAFPQVQVTRETVEVYHDVLGDLDAGACREAVRDLLRTAERWPAPATIRRRVAQHAGLLAPAPGDAWGEVMNAARFVGVYGSPTFSHPAVAATVKALGWRNLCLSENPDTIRAHFLRAYEAESTKSDTRTVADALQGVTAAAAIGPGA